MNGAASPSKNSSIIDIRPILMALNKASATAFHGRLQSAMEDMFPGTLVTPDSVSIEVARLNRGIGSELELGGVVVRVDYVVRVTRSKLGTWAPAEGQRVTIDGTAARVARVTDRPEETAVHLELTQAGK